MHLIEYDTLITEKQIPKDKEFKDFVNYNSKAEVRPIDVLLPPSSLFPLLLLLF